ncbi:hypothetical protein AcW1_002679 [Taiwanofungus camphoratus]|nr:hypothetical protein AcW1_002679 [Antrodia cinnamomea]
MAQPQRKATDLRPSSSVSPLDQPRTELALTIRPGHGPTTAESFSLVTHDIQGLRSVLAECRRIKAVSVTQEVSDASTAFSWLAPYLSRRVEPPILSPIPPDLRIITKPLHTRLSPASAGLPGDDASDIAAIREDWVRKRITEELVASCNETSSLRIRIGTFNVNGKLPSQDLSAWVRGRLDGPELIPPLKEISPLSLGEIPHNAAEHNPEDDRSARLNSAVISDDTFTAFSAVRTLSSSRVSAITESTSTSNLDTREGVPEDPTDPDLLVLAFQELDLSTEALLYSTKTVREDAWCMAAFAGLGEKAVLYERLASKQLVGMLLVIIVKKRMKDMFCDVKSASVGAGIMGMMGNKGATAIRLVFTPTLSSFASPVKPTVITFVNSHLAAFDEMYEKRNADFHDLSKRLIFDSGIPVVGPRVEGTGRPESVLLNVFQTDVLFWMVSVNAYRFENVVLRCFLGPIS